MTLRIFPYYKRVEFIQWVCRLLGVPVGGVAPSRTSLLMRCVPHIETAMSEHNDGHRLYGEVCRHLYDLGYEGWMDRLTDPRSLDAAGLEIEPEGQGELPPTMNDCLRAAYAESKSESPEARILKARGGQPLA